MSEALRSPSKRRSSVSRVKVDLKDAPTIDWDDLQGSKTLIGLAAWEQKDSIEDLIGTLSELKLEHLDRTRKLDGTFRGASSSAKRMQKSSSEPTMGAIGAGPRQLPSHFLGSESFSFGPGYQKPRHLKGKLKVPVLEPRDPECLKMHDECVPGPGTHEVRHYLGLHSPEAGGGGTGGWPAGDHDVFLRVFHSSDFRGEASPDFFDRVKVLLPEVPRLKIVEHVKWLIDYEHHKLKLHHKGEKFREETHTALEFASTGEMTRSAPLMKKMEDSKAVRWDKTKEIRKKLDKLHGQAEMERARWGLKEQTPAQDGFRAEQHSHSASHMVDGGMRAHPFYKKSPGYTWSASREIRDVRDKNLTHLSQVRSGTHLDNPGPGHYVGQHEADRIMKRSPCYTMRIKFKCHQIPSMPGPDHDKCKKNADWAERMRHQHAHHGEITISLLWDSADDLDLHVVPPGGRKGGSEISRDSKQFLGGSMDCGRDSDTGRAHSKPLENIYWHQYLGKDKVNMANNPPPPVGEYKVYMKVRNKKNKDINWRCRIQVGAGRDAEWIEGVARKDGPDDLDIHTFKYAGPVDMSTKIQEDLGVIQLRKPAWKLGYEDARCEKVCSTEGNAFTNYVSTPEEIGPGKYTHSTAFVSNVKNLTK